MSLYKIADSEVWWASITLGGQRIRFSTGEYDRRQAQKVHDQRKAKQHDAPKLKGKTWGSAVLRWAEIKNPSADEMASMLRFSKHYHDRLLHSVTADSLEKVLRRLFPNPATYNRNRARIQGMLKLSGVKLDVVKKVEDQAVERDWLTPEQWNKLYAELPVHLKASALFAVSTGLRQANVLGLTWDRVDLARSVAWIDSGDSKSGNAISVPLNVKARAALDSVAGQHAEFVFTYRGQPVTEIKTAFTKACCRAGLGRLVRPDGSDETDFCGVRPKGLHYTGFTWHGLRHTWATWHVQNGTPLDVLQKLGGWADYKMVLVYAKHSAGYLSQYADNITPSNNPRPHMRRTENADVPDVGVDAPPVLPTKPKKL